MLDEPTVGLDPAQRLEFRTLLRDLGPQACVLVFTHLVEDVAAACGNVVLVDEDRLVFPGTPADVAARSGAADAGDNPIERCYTVLPTEHRAKTGVAR